MQALAQELVAAIGDAQLAMLRQLRARAMRVTARSQMFPLRDLTTTSCSPDTRRAREDGSTR